MVRKISNKKYKKKLKKTKKNRKNIKPKKVYLGKKQFGSGLDNLSNIYPYLKCQEVIRQVSNLDKNAINSVNWQELNNTLIINVTNEVHLLNAECSLCSMVIDERQRNYFKEFYNKCKLLNLYQRYIGEYNNVVVDVGVLRSILLNTIPHEGVENIQNFLIQLGANLTEIGDGAFSNNLLTSVTIPDSVTKIGDKAFESNQLTDVRIPNSVTVIGFHAFSNNRLTSVIIPDLVKIIYNDAFSNNLLISVTISDSVTEIRGGAFSRNKLTYVIIPNSVTEIGYRAFSHNRLTSVTLPSMYKGTKTLSAFSESSAFSHQSNIISTYGMGIKFKYT